MNKSDAISSRFVSLLVIRAEEPLAVEMNKMIRRVGNPYFGLPGDVAQVLDHRLAIQEGGDEDEPRRRPFEQPLEFAATAACQPTS